VCFPVNRIFTYGSPATLSYSPNLTTSLSKLARVSSNRDNEEISVFIYFFLTAPARPKKLYLISRSGTKWLSYAEDFWQSPADSSRYPSARQLPAPGFQNPGGSTGHF